MARNGPKRVARPVGVRLASFRRDKKLGRSVSQHRAKTLCKRSADTDTYVGGPQAMRLYEKLTSRDVSPKIRSIACLGADQFDEDTSKRYRWTRAMRKNGQEYRTQMSSEISAYSTSINSRSPLDPGKIQNNSRLFFRCPTCRAGRLA